MATTRIAHSFAHSSTLPAVGHNLQKPYSVVRPTTFPVDIRAWVKEAVHAVTDNHNSEKFYQDHLNAIFLGLYAEMIVAVSLAIVGIQFFTR
jgi:hypothetical protein